MSVSDNVQSRAFSPVHPVCMKAGWHGSSDIAPCSLGGRCCCSEQVPQDANPPGYSLLVVTSVLWRYVNAKALDRSYYPGVLG